MNRRQFAAALAAMAAPAWAAPARFERGVLWKITRKAMAPSHVFGTIHVSDARLGELPAPVRRALDASRRVMLEFLVDGYSRERFLEAALFERGRTLEQAIGAADFERAAARLEPAGLAPEFVNRLKPWAVLLNLRAAGHPDASSFDAQLTGLARARRLPIEQLEGVEELIFTFDECPMESQVALLKHSLAHQDELAALAEQTLGAYLKRDLAALWRLREAHHASHPEVAAHQALFTKRVVLDRSVVMAFRMQRGLRRGDAFVAVGALHLYGPKGVLALLEQDGYRASRVY